MRPHNPWYSAAKNAWCVELGYTRHRLGKHPDGVDALEGGNPAMRLRARLKKSRKRLDRGRLEAAISLADCLAKFFA